MRLEALLRRWVDTDDAPHSLAVEPVGLHPVPGGGRGERALHGREPVSGNVAPAATRPARHHRRRR